MPLEKDQLLGLHDIDEGLTLRLLMGKEHPWVSIDNKMTEKKKLVRMFFVENGKDLQIRTGKGGELRTYDHADIVEGLSQLCRQAMSLPEIKERYTQIVRTLITKLHEPRYVNKEADFALLPEEKRKNLWLGCFPEPSEPGVMRPCFSADDKEAALFDTIMDEDIAPFGKGFAMGARERNADTLKKHGVVQKLIVTKPGRWLEPLSIGVAGILFGMHEWSGEPSFPFFKSFWRPFTDPLYTPEKGNFDEVRENSRGFMEVLQRYIKNYYALPLVDVEERVDAGEALKEEGYGRRERFDDHSNLLGNHVYQIERFIRDDETTVLLQKTKGAGVLPDKVVRLAGGLYEECLAYDACGSSEDSRFTMLQLLFSLRISQWLDLVRRIAGPAILKK